MSKMTKIKAAAIQMSIVTGDRERNIAKAERFLDMAAEDGVKLAVLPEYFSVGFPAKQLREFAEPPTAEGPTIKRMVRKAKEHKMYIVAGTIIEKGEDGKLYNTSVLIGPNGEIIGKYRKVHIWRLSGLTTEALSGMSAGDEWPVFKTDIGTIGIMVQHDDDFPESSRILALKGADIICHPATLRGVWLGIVPGWMQQASGHNGAYVILANWVGMRNGTTYDPGFSCITSPVGDLVAIGRAFFDNEGPVIGTLDFERQKKWREEVPLLKLRRPETYKALLE